MCVEFIDNETFVRSEVVVVRHVFVVVRVVPLNGWRKKLSA
jgi:isocitrate dehydrogenase kinase/phosphatase